MKKIILKTSILFVLIMAIVTLPNITTGSNTKTDCKQVFRVIYQGNPVCNAQVTVTFGGNLWGGCTTMDSECLCPSSGGMNMVSGNSYTANATWWQGAFERTGQVTFTACTFTPTLDITVQ